MWFKTRSSTSNEKVSVQRKPSRKWEGNLLNGNKYLQIIHLIRSSHPKYIKRASLVVQWIRTCLPMQQTRVQSLAREDATCRRAAKPCAATAESELWSLHTAATEPAPTARARQREKPRQWGAATTGERSPALHSQQRSTQSNEDSVQK